MFWFTLLIVNVVVVAIMLPQKHHGGSSGEDAMSDSLAGFVFWVVMAILFVANIASIRVHCL